MKKNSICQPIIVIQGGAGDIPDNRDQGKYSGTIAATRLGYNCLKQGGSAMDAVESAVKHMELDECFNAGYGSVLDLDGRAVMEASIMDGSTLKAGCVTLIEDIKHPISLARRVLEKTNHTFLGGEGAMRFAKEENFEILSPTGTLITKHAIDALERFKSAQQIGQDTINAETEIGNRDSDNKQQLTKITTIKVKDFGEVGTVGAVALDQFGNFAVATSTGGMTGKLPGRIGDTPVIGSGTYADNFGGGGCSTTGHGDTIMKFNVAQKILQRIELLKEPAQLATETVLIEMTKRLIQKAGAISIDTKSNIGIYFTAKKMAWAYQNDDSIIHYGIKPMEHLTESA